MVTIDTTLLISSPPETVFEYVADLRKEVRWNPTVLTAALTTDGRLRAGSVFRIKAQQFGEFDVRIVRYEPPGLVSAVAEMKPMRSAYTYHVEPIDGGSRLRHSTDITPRGAMNLLRPFVGIIVRRQLNMMFSRLKELLESPQTKGASVRL